jgi:cytochrome b subunit of formate dehydrogenase
LVLDENICPVARMRLFSTGVGINNRMHRNEPVTGDKGCLACGNCVDACPVVLDKKRFVFLNNQRTSMSLENIVGIACRRCFSCVRACPQVSKPVKEYVIGYRRPQKVAHTILAGLIFCLALTGILIYHYGQDIPPPHRLFYRYLHIFLGFSLLLTPVFYYLLDNRHFKRTFGNAFRFGKADIDWAKDLWAHLKSPARHEMPFWGEFNPYQKFWIAYLTCVVPVLAVTGLIKIFAGFGDSTAPWLTFMTTTHAAAAFCTDLLVVLHLYVKYLKNISWLCADMYRCWRKNKDLRYAFLYDFRSEGKKP